MFAAAGDKIASHGNLWFTEIDGNKIGKITPSGTISEYPLPTPASGNRLAMISPSGTITEFAPLPTPNSEPSGIALGNDGNFWFVEYQNQSIGQMTPGGVVTEWPIPTASSGAYAITNGPDGNLWFAEPSVGNVGTITPAGQFT